MMPEDSPQQGGTGQQSGAGKPAAPDGHGSLASLRNIGKAALADFAVLEIQTIGQLAGQDADHLYLTLCQKTRQRHDPACMMSLPRPFIRPAREKPETGGALRHSAKHASRTAAFRFIAPVYNAGSPDF